MTLISYSDDDDGITLAKKLHTQPSSIVGDGSYEPSNGHGSSAVIFETNDKTSRATLPTIAPSNNQSACYSDNDAYGCELVAILTSLLLIHHMEQKFGTSFQPITLCVDNDRALATYDHTHNIDTTAQHFDLLWSIRRLETTMQTTISTEQV